MENKHKNNRVIYLIIFRMERKLNDELFIKCYFVC